MWLPLTPSISEAIRARPDLLGKWKLKHHKKSKEKNSGLKQINLNFRYCPHFDHLYLGTGKSCYTK